MSGESVIFSLGANNAALETGLKQAEHQVHHFKEQAAEILTGMFATVGIEQLISDFARVGEQAAAYGTTVEALQRVRGVAETSGTSLDAVAKALAKLRADGGDTLKKLGLDAQEFAHAGMDGQVLLLAEAFDKIKDPQQRINMELETFGARGREILPMFSEGAEEIRKKMESTSVASAETVAILRAAEDEIKSMTNTIKVWGAETFGVIHTGIKNASSAIGLLGTYIGNLPAGFAKAKEAATDFIDADKMLRFQTQFKNAHPDPGSSEWDKTLGKGASKGEESKRTELTLAERIAQVEEEAARKKLSAISQMIANANERIDLEEKLAQTSDPAERKSIEDRMVAIARERIALEDRAAKELESDQKRYADQDERDAKKKEQDAARLAKQQARSEEEMGKSWFERKQQSFLDLKSIAGYGTGQQLGGVNYKAVNSEAQQQLEIQTQMRDYLRSIDEKKWAVEVPDAS